MQKNVKLGAALTAVGAGSALAAADAAEHGAATIAVVAGVLTGACTALGVTSLIIGWATRRPAGEAVEV
jgi:predicted benzoate:H+ symporter BenE